MIGIQELARCVLLATAVCACAAFGRKAVAGDAPARVGQLRFDAEKLMMQPRCLAFSADGKEIVLAYLDDRADVRISRWLITSGKRVDTLLRNPEPFPTRVATPWPGPRISLSGDGQVVAFRGDRDTIFVSDTSSGKMLLRLPTRMGCPALSPDGKLFAHFDRPPPMDFFGHDERDAWNAQVVVVETASGKSLGQIPARRFQDNCFSADGEVVAVCEETPFGWGDDSSIDVGENSSVAVWCLRPPFKRLADIRPPKASSLSEDVLSPDGKILAASYFKSDANQEATYLWDARTGKLIRKHLFGGGGVKFSPDSKRLAILNVGQIDVFSVETGVKLMKVCRSAGRFWCPIAFSPDNKTLATPDSDGLIHLWNTDTGTELTGR